MTTKKTSAGGWVCKYGHYHDYGEQCDCERYEAEQQIRQMEHKRAARIAHNRECYEHGWSDYYNA